MIDKVKKQFKNTEMLLDIYLKDYHGVSIYIRLDYYKKDKNYKVAWVDLSHIIDNKILPVVSYEYVPDNVIKQIEKLLIDIDAKEYKSVTDGDNLVFVNSLFKYGRFNISFRRYIPKELAPLFNIFVIIFDNLPRKLNGFLQELGAEIIGNKSKFEYEEPFDFDLKEGNLEELFGQEILSRGKEYFKQNRVLFLEKINDVYFAVVGGKSLYVVIIRYDEKKKIMAVHCSCPCDFKCKHIVAVIESIRKEKYRKFYKISHKNSDMSMLDRIMKFNFLLTIGIDDQGNNYLVIEDGMLKLLPVIDDHGKSNWLVLEDDDKDTLTKRLDDILGKK